MKTVFTHITLGIQLAAVMLIFVYAGYRLDVHFNKTPLFMALFAALGMAAGMYNLIRELGKMEAQNKKTGGAASKSDEEKPKDGSAEKRK